MQDRLESKEVQVQDLKLNERADEDEEARKWIENLQQLYKTGWQAPLLPSTDLANSIKKLLSNNFDGFLSLVNHIFRIRDEDWKQRFFNLMGENFLLSLSKCTGKDFSDVLSHMSVLAKKIDLILQLGENDVLKIVGNQEDFVRIFCHLKLTGSNIDKDKVVQLNAIKDKALDKVFLKNAPARSEAILTVLRNPYFHPGEKYCFLLCVLENYERKRISHETSLLRGIFGFHKEGKLSGVQILKDVINKENGKPIPNGGVWGDGKLGEIAKAYRSYIKN